MNAIQSFADRQECDPRCAQHAECGWDGHDTTHLSFAWCEYSAYVHRANVHAASTREHLHIDIQAKTATRSHVAHDTTLLFNELKKRLLKSPVLTGHRDSYCSLYTCLCLPPALSNTHVSLPSITSACEGDCRIAHNSLLEYFTDSGICPHCNRPVERRVDWPLLPM